MVKLIIIMILVLFIYITAQEKFIEIIDDHHSYSLYLDVFIGQPKQLNTLKTKNQHK